jgi:hypothetical protein
LSVGQTLAIVRSDVVNVNAQNAMPFIKSVADYNRFENAFKTGGVTATTDQAKLANGVLSHN